VTCDKTDATQVSDFESPPNEGTSRRLNGSGEAFARVSSMRTVLVISQ
jgi:hypothetical protein